MCPSHRTCLLYTSSFHELKESLRALFHLSPRQAAYPGHEEAGTVGHDPAEG